MSSQKETSLTKSFLQFSAGPWVAAAISFLTTPITTYLIIPEEFGKASMYTVAFSLILQVVLLGTDQSFVRMFYEYDEDRRSVLLWNSLIPSLSMSFIASAILLVFRQQVSLLLFDDPDLIMPVIALSLTIVIAVLERFASLVLRMKKRGIAFSSLRVVSTLSSAGGLITYALLFARNFYAIIFGTVISHLLVLIVSILMELDFWKRGFLVSIASMKITVLYGLPFVPAFMVTWLFNSMDKLALRSFSTFEEIGFYTAANKMVGVLLLVQVGFSTFWTPVAFETYENKPGDTSLFSKVSKLLAGVMFAVSLGLIGFKDVIVLILDKAYLPAASIMPFLIFYPIMYTVSETTVGGINFKKKTHWHLWISIMAALVNFIGNTALVPVYGARGAALATGVSYVVFFYARTLISRKLFPVDYGLTRYSIGTLVLIAVALVNTFSDSAYLEAGSTVLGLVIISLLYKAELKYVFSSSRRIVGRIGAKRRAKSDHLE
ncbi:polysaccharide biosynthesis protein [Mesotoga sp. SC_4PWA21]|nr:polysaccharide biosynthesis protein [Mesotoga sp. SC_4PWA21]